MGVLLKPLSFSFHSSDIIARHQISNRLIFITLFAVAFAHQLYVVSAAVDQNEQQDAELQSSCEAKTLEDVPPDPVSIFMTTEPRDCSFDFLSFNLQFYDASDVTVTAARKLSEFIIGSTKSKSIKYSKAQVDEFRLEANNLAKDALKEDENLLAVAIAAPSMPLAVVQFRDKVENRNTTDHTFLSIYWRELGIAWNQSDGAQFWGAPFKDCGPLQGRWLWPFSVTVVEQHIK